MSGVQNGEKKHWESHICLLLDNLAIRELVISRVDYEDENYVPFQYLGIPSKRL